MFEGEEKKAREELIQLYEDFIKNPKDLSLEERSLNCERKYGAVPVLSEAVSYAGGCASDIALDEMTVEKAEELLKSLKEEK